MKETAVNKSTTGVFEKKCLFCKKSQRKVKQKQQPLISCTLDSCEDFMKNIIIQSEDQKLVYEYGNVNFPAKEVCYHHKCRLEFTYEASRSKSQDTAILDDAYTNIFSYIQTHVIDESQPESIISLHDKFQNFCKDKDIGNINDISTQRTLFSKIQAHFGDQIRTCYYSKKVGTVLFEASLDKEMVPSLLKGNMEAADDDSTILLKAARSLRQLLLAVKSTCDPLPNVLTSQHFQNGQAPIPEKCMQFCMELLCVNPSEPTEKERRLAFSLGSDLLFNVTKGHVKPAKQLVMGLGIKSITGSEKVCKILHKFGHAISCSEERGIIAEIGEAITEKHKATPDGLYREPGLATSVAWDNYDELTDSIAAGRLATHDCMGVVYQNRKPEGASAPPELAATDNGDAGPVPKRRRTSYTGQNELQVHMWLKFIYDDMIFNI